MVTKDRYIFIEGIRARKVGYKPPGQPPIFHTKEQLVKEAYFVTETRSFEVDDGERYVEIQAEISPGQEEVVGRRAGRALVNERTTVYMPSLRASILANPASTSTKTVEHNPGEEDLPNRFRFILDTVYPQMRNSDRVVVTVEGRPHPGIISTPIHNQMILVDSSATNPSITTPIQIPASIVDIDFEIDLTSDPGGEPSIAGLSKAIVIHYNMVEAGSPTSVAHTHLQEEHLSSDSPALVLAPNIPAPQAELSQDFFLTDADGLTIARSGKLQFSGEGGQFCLDSDQDPIPSLRTPITIHGNLCALTRGEQVKDEVLGSGDASQAFQTFELKKGPLTYLSDANHPDNHRSTLAVRVNGRPWREVRTLVNAGPDDEVFVIETDADGKSLVKFGDGSLGRRLPTGVGNVVADYRVGSGAQHPPMGTINQIGRPTGGLVSAYTSTAARGGKDADRPEAIRQGIRGHLLTLGRLVSLADFQAAVSTYSGIINAKVTWEPIDARGTKGVRIRYISTDENLKVEELRQWLAAQARENVPFDIQPAQTWLLPSVIDIALELAPGYDFKAIEAEVHRRMNDRDTGPLHLANLAIGAPTFLSALYEPILAVEGVVGVREVASPSVLNIADEHVLTVEKDWYRVLKLKLRQWTGEPEKPAPKPPAPPSSTSKNTLYR